MSTKSNSKKKRLTQEQKQIIYKIYDENISKRSQPDYESIVLALLQDTPSVSIIKAAIVYHIKQREIKSKAKIEQTKQDLADAKKELSKITGEQAEELDFDSNSQLVVTKDNAVMLKRYYEALNEQLRYEKEIGKYIHIHDVEQELTKISTILEREFSTINSQLLTLVVIKKMLWIK